MKKPLKAEFVLLVFMILVFLGVLDYYLLRKIKVQEDVIEHIINTKNKGSLQCLKTI